MSTLILLPGLMCDASVWAPQVAALSPQARCQVPDYGLRNSLTAMAQQVLDEALAPRFALAGHSMGGRVALEVLRLAPQRVTHLALLDTGTHPRAPGEAGDGVNPSQAASVTDLPSCFSFHASLAEVVVLPDFDDDFFEFLHGLSLLGGPSAGLERGLLLG